MNSFKKILVGVITLVIGYYTVKGIDTTLDKAGKKMFRKDK